MNAATIAHALDRSRRSGPGWLACCPAHDDHNPSLSLRDAPEGRVLARCHAGCSQAVVISALKEKGLWPQQDRSREKRRIVAEYNYTDERDAVLYQVVRTDPKGFFQRYPDGRGGWVYRKHPRQVLYRLASVLKARIVFVCEGEKDVDRLRDEGFMATTNAGGANAPWLSQYTEALRGLEVILIPDNDPPGRRRVVAIAKALLGHAARIRILELPACKDVSEWFDQGHSEVEFIQLASDSEENN
jgi:putative DNA primase/helicase